MNLTELPEAELVFPGLKDLDNEGRYCKGIAGRDRISPLNRSGLKCHCSGLVNIGRLDRRSTASRHQPLIN